MNPLIGICAYGLGERQVDSPHYSRYYVLPGEYVAAIRRAGGVPVLLPPGEESFAGWLGALAGIVIPGGTDVGPDKYGGDPHDPRILPVEAQRDESEIALTKAAVEADMPLLLVCRGMQILNVAFGGTLHADLGSLGNRDIHRSSEGLWATHEVDAIPGSTLADAMGTTRAAPTSGHHQGVDVVGDGLDVVARAPDGIVEALGVPGHRWAVAVQWHPEVTAAEDRTQQGIFDSLVAATQS